MRINEVETLVGITKKNIRFYEEQGLLQPRRSAENGYRDYEDQEVAILKRVKLLRKLGLPIEDIRRIFSGELTLSDGMRRHLVTLERQQKNLEESRRLCVWLRDLELPMEGLDTDGVLARMEELEQSGTAFPDQRRQDVRVRYVAPVLVAVVMVGLMLGISGLIIWAWIQAPQDAPPLWFLLMCLGLNAAVGVGVIGALLQRLREIGKGEIDDARRY